MKAKKTINLMLLAVANLLLLINCSNQNQKEPISVVSIPLKQFIQKLKGANEKVIDEQGNSIPAKQFKLQKNWDGNICSFILKNTGTKTIHPKNIILFDIPNHGLPPTSPVYGEGFQMLHQNGGTLAHRENIGSYPDISHYSIPEPNNLPTAYGMLTINTGPEEVLLMGFTSCCRFIGRISFNAEKIQVSLDGEGIKMVPGEEWELESFMITTGDNRSDILKLLANEIATNHPPILHANIPTGWCSWYCYGPDINNDIISENLDVFAEKLSEIKYIQIDDGYQAFMGDWLDPNPEYGEMKETLKTIRQKGFEPAIWIAPFIAEKNSRIFREHPEWFIKNEDGTPLNSATIGFGGWRRSPWYVLDGTNPKVQLHLKNLFKEMREEWKVNYFKLDANYWGAIHGGYHFDESATRIEAYRQGMEAILDGCDEETVILGCNAPIWPSLGLVTAMRTSGDVYRSWQVIRSTSFENLNRAWQNGTLWNTDPDCILLTENNVFQGNKKISENEWMFHATAIHATGGLILNGDKAENLQENQLKILRKLVDPSGKAPRLLSDRMDVLVTETADNDFYYFFNWSEKDSLALSVDFRGSVELFDYWTDEFLGSFKNSYKLNLLPPRSARLLVDKKSK